VIDVWGFWQKSETADTQESRAVGVGEAHSSL
jgi:hypothetical protein